MIAGWWCTPLIPALGRQRRADLFEFEASLVYIGSSRTDRAVTQRNPVLKNREERFIRVSFLSPAPVFVLLSSSWMLEQPVPPALATGRSQPGLHSLEGLPPPERLCRRKRKKLHSERVQRGPGNMPARVRAVTYHLEDLRRRQGITNELKKAQWGSCGAPPQLLVLEEGCGLFSTAGCLDVEDRAACPQEESHFVTPRDQLLWSPWTPLGQGWTYASGRPSSLAYSTVTARRNPICDVQRMEELESEE
ncbi:protein INCA1 isoform X1 [Psammomys obesus]|uniref:protein INCA1 isoform X1 n=1 Tax=Psammomys obesus TaxID=48139 RepID=UPI0024536228|nr:protein INCA1 isoform X1 [Psammomys obesus]